MKKKSVASWSYRIRVSLSRFSPADFSLGCFSTRSFRDAKVRELVATFERLKFLKLPCLSQARERAAFRFHRYARVCLKSYFYYLKSVLLFTALF